MRYVVRFQIPCEITVAIDAHDDEEAADQAWEYANSFAETVVGDHRNVSADISLDGVGASEVSPARVAADGTEATTP